MLFFESKAVDPPVTIYMGKDKVCAYGGQMTEMCAAAD